MLTYGPESERATVYMCVHIAMTTEEGLVRRDAC